MAPIVGGLIAGVVFTKISVLKKPSKNRLKNQGAVSKTDQLGLQSNPQPLLRVFSFQKVSKILFKKQRFCFENSSIGCTKPATFVVGFLFLEALNFAFL
jgi:hypothetical protein